MASCPEFVVALAVVAVVFFGYLGAVVDHFVILFALIASHRWLFRRFRLLLMR